MGVICEKQVTCMRRFFIRAPYCVAIAGVAVGEFQSRAQTWVEWRSADGGNDHYYALTPTATNWDAAQKLAISWRGTLATITSSNEQNFINTTFLTGKFEHLPLWIGLHKGGAKGGFSGKVGALQVQVAVQPNADFRWVTGEALSYTDWKTGEPSDTAPGENYVAINWAYSDVPPRGIKGDWNDTPLNGTAGYGGKTDGPYFGLVERELNPSRTVRTGFGWYAGCIALLAAVAILVGFWFIRLRKHQRAIALITQKQSMACAEQRKR